MVCGCSDQSYYKKFGLVAKWQRFIIEVYLTLTFGGPNGQQFSCNNRKLFGWNETNYDAQHIACPITRMVD